MTSWPCPIHIDSERFLQVLANEVGKEVRRQIKDECCRPYLQDGKDIEDEVMEACAKWLVAHVLAEKEKQ